MPDEKLSELIERVERASGPDRAIDADLAERFDLPLCVEPDCLPDVMRVLIRRARERGDPDPEIGHYTASLDAALSLVERVRPGCTYLLTTQREKGRSLAIIYVHADVANGVVDTPSAFASTPPLAVLSALLRSMQTAHLEEAR